jgi:hypothetical protein
MRHVSAGLHAAYVYEHEAIVERSLPGDAHAFAARHLAELAELARPHPARLWRRRQAGYSLKTGEHRSTNPRGYRCVTAPGIFSNPFLGPGAVDAYRIFITAAGRYPLNLSPRLPITGLRYIPTPEQPAEVRRRLPELRGKDLCCYCPPGQLCHAYVLLELANDGYVCDCERCAPPCRPWDPTPEELAAADAEVARQKLPGGKFYTGPLTDFELACAERALGHPIPT